MRLTLLVTSPRVAPGLLTWSAWQAIAAADLVLASDAGLPLARAITAAGHDVGVLPDPTGDALLGAAAARPGPVVWLASDAEADRLPSELAATLVGRPDALPEVEVLHGSYDVPGARLLDLVTVMDRLRQDCPWDREQTHRSLAAYLLEESYEVLEAIENGDAEHLREELGDLLLQVYFHARIASEDAADGFAIDDVAAGIVEKLVRRHPHVFAAAPGADPVPLAELEADWEKRKATEKGRASVLDGIPLAMPALSLAAKVAGRAARVGVEPQGVDAMGERLLELVVEARVAGLDAEQELRDAVRRLAEQVREAEAAAGHP